MKACVLKAILSSVVLLFLFTPASAQEIEVLLRTIDDTDDGDPILSIQGPQTNGTGGYALFASFLDSLPNNQVSSWRGWGREGFGPSRKIVCPVEDLSGLSHTGNLPFLGGIDESGRILYRPVTVNSQSGNPEGSSLWLRDESQAIPDQLFLGEGDPIASLNNRVYSAILPKGITQSGVPYWSATVFTTSGFFEGGGLFAGENQQVLVRRGDPAPSFFPAGTTVGGNTVATDMRMSARGSHWINVSQARFADLSFSKVYVTVDGEVALSPSGNPVFKDMPIDVSDGGLPGEQWNFFQRLGINEAGDFMATSITTAAESSNSLISFNGSVLYREGDTYDFAGQPVVTTGSYLAISARMNENADIGYFSECSNGRQALFLNDRIVLTDQVLIDWDQDGSPDSNATLTEFNLTELSVGDRINGAVSMYILARVSVGGELRRAALSVTVQEDDAFEGFCDEVGGVCSLCPCANDAAPGTLGGCLNSAGESARLEASGVPSLAADTLRFQVRNAGALSFASVNSAVNALPNMGPCPAGSGILSSVLDGRRCIGGNLIRHGARPTDAEGNAGFTTNGWGPPNGPINGLLAQAGFAAGQTRHFQCFYRQEATAGCGTGQNTSNGVTVVAVP